MRAVARYSVIFLPSSATSNSATRAHFMPRTVFAASATAFSVAFAKLSFDAPTISMTFCGMLHLLQAGDEYIGNSRTVGEFGPSTKERDPALAADVDKLLNSLRGKF